MTTETDRAAASKGGATEPLRGESVPLRAHFVWFGEQFPWVNLLALRSAALHGGLSEVVLHHDSDLTRTPYYRELCETPGVTLRRLKVPELLEQCTPYSEALGAVFQRLQTPATRADLVRLGLLYSQGGIYLDMDTVTVRSLAPLCQDVPAFIGQERVVYPADVVASTSQLTKFAALTRSEVRNWLRLLPRGWLLFRSIERFYHLAANNAVLASAARAVFVTDAIERMIELSPEQQPITCALGPHLVQATLKHSHREDVVVHPPEVFYPLAPELSAHWFRNDSGSDLSRVLTPRTRVVHWYATVRTKSIAPQIHPDYVRRHAHKQLFSALAATYGG